MGYFLLQPLFQPGQLLLSPAIHTRGIDPHPLLWRHLAGDWGDLCDYDLEANTRALSDGGPILSRFQAPGISGEISTVEIMTEDDRSYTVIYVVGEPDFSGTAC
jgi:hypothetical protein